MSENPDSISIEQIQEARNRNIGRLLLRGARDFQTRSIEKLHARGYHRLKPTHMTALMYLDLKGTRIISLAERANITKQSMGELVQELEEQGYVMRAPDPADGRAVLITFTDAGIQFLQDAYQIKLEIEAEYTELLGEDGFTILRSLLTRLLNEAPEASIE